MARTPILPDRHFPRWQATGAISRNGRRVGWETKEIFSPAGSSWNASRHFLFNSPPPTCQRRPFRNTSTICGLLGGEIIRDLQETPKLRKKPVNELIDILLENDGPLIYHCESEEQQRSFESTCRKLRRFLNRSGT